MIGPDDNKVRWLFLALRIPDTHEEDPEQLADDLVAILNAEWPSPYDIEVAGIPAPQWLTPETLAALRRAVGVLSQPQPAPTVDPEFAEALESAGRCLVTHPRDWGTDRRDAWLWGLILGWGSDDPEDPDEIGDEAMIELAEKHGWDADEVARLRRLRAAFARHAGVGL